MVYMSAYFGLYCNKCKKINYEGHFVIDKAVNPTQQQNHYTQIDTFYNWVDFLLCYKNTIPINVEQ